MTATAPDPDDLESALSRSRDASWETRREAAQGLGRFADERAQDRLVEMLDDPENLVVSQTAAEALVRYGGRPGLQRVAAAFDSLDDQAAAYVAVTVSDALGDVVFERLLEVITQTGDAQVQEGARHLGAQIGMTTSPQWKHAFPSARS